DRQREEVEADVAPKDRIGRAERDLIDPAQEHVPLVTARDPEEERRDEKEPHEPEGHRQRPAPAALGVDDDSRHLRSEREVHVRQGEDEECRSEHREGVEPGGKAPQVHRLEAEATEPEEVGEETDEWPDQDRDEKKDKDDDREDDHPARGSRYAVAAPAETREVDIRPVDVSPVPAPVTATPALAHPSSG